MTILVFGGSGMVGTALKNEAYFFDAIFLSSKDCDLSNIENIKKVIEKHSPELVVHLAADVGGLYENMNNIIRMFENNLLMNFNLLKCCNDYGVKRVMSCATTCMFPDEMNILTEKDIHNGEPHSSNFGYAYAKRMLEIQSRCYNTQKDRQYFCIIPCNIYGPHDNFDLDSAHVVPALIHKTYIAKKEDTELIVYGNGKSKRQFIYSKDLARLISLLAQRYTSCEPIILAPSEEYKISNLVGIILNCNKYYKRSYDKSKSNGQYKKYACNDSLLRFLQDNQLDFKFTSLKSGIQETIEWFNSNYPYVRGGVHFSKFAKIYPVSDVDNSVDWDSDLYFRPSQVTTSRAIFVIKEDGEKVEQMKTQYREQNTIDVLFIHNSNIDSANLKLIIQKFTNPTIEIPHVNPMYEVRFRLVEKMIKNILTIRDNSVYRVGDVIMRKGDRWKRDRNTIMKEDRYKYTILREYLETKTKENDWETLKTIVHNNCFRLKRKPSYDELVIHIRAGDAIQFNWCLSTSYVDVIRDALKQCPYIKKITFVTLLHYGNYVEKQRWIYNEESEQKNYEKFRKVLGKIVLYFPFMEYDLLSHENIDIDMCYLGLARNRLLDRGGFSKCIDMINH